MKCFSSGGDLNRQLDGESLLRNGCTQSKFDIQDMFYILRHKKSRICRGCDDGFPTQGSQVSTYLMPNMHGDHFLSLSVGHRDNN